jgi:hypothetical protein
MKSSYVSNAHLNIADANKTAALKLLDMNGEGLVKIFSVYFIPASENRSAIDECKITLYDSDPGVSGQSFYQKRIVSGSYANYADITNCTVESFSPGGILVDCNDIYIQATGVGICFASIVYQGS